MSADTTHRKVTLVLSKDDLANVERLHQRLGEASRAVTVGTALSIAETLLSKMDDGCQIFEKHTDGSYSRLKIIKDDAIAA